MLGYHAWLIANLLLDNATQTRMETELENKKEKSSNNSEMLRRLVHWIGRSWQASGSQEFDGDFCHVPKQGVASEVYRLVLVSSFFIVAGVGRPDERIHMVGHEIIGKVVNSIFQLHGKVRSLGRSHVFRVVLRKRLSGLLIVHPVLLATVTGMIGFEVAFDFACRG